MYTPFLSLSLSLPLSLSASQDLNAEESSLGDVLEEETEWDVNSDVTIATDVRGGSLTKRSLQTEKEIRYIRMCIEQWERKGTL